jgi:hypothetical protein
LAFINHLRRHHPDDVIDWEDLDSADIPEPAHTNGARRSRRKEDNDGDDDDDDEVMTSDIIPALANPGKPKTWAERLLDKDEAKKLLSPDSSYRTIVLLTMLNALRPGEKILIISSSYGHQ